jgi:hypothetical protein
VLSFAALWLGFDCWRESRTKRIAYPANREGLLEHFPDPCDTPSATTPTLSIACAPSPASARFALTILYEIHDVTRFERVQQFASYAQLVKCAQRTHAGDVDPLKRTVRGHG